jgi:hypothetical protein
MMPQPPARSNESGRQPLAKMTIAFLLDDHEKIGSTDPEATRDYCDNTFPQAQAPVTHQSLWIQFCDQTGVAEKLFNTSSLHTGFLHHTNGHYTPQALSVKGVNHIISPSSGRAKSSGTESCGYDSSSPSSEFPTDLSESSSSACHLHLRHHHRCHDFSVRAHEWTEVSTREPRSTRPPYNEEQMFFIVHHRIVKQLSWPEIEDEFAKFFKLRSKSGLTSVYYRIRKSWGMEQVLKNQTRCGDDLDVVEKRADHLSRAFLENIGYFD